jgi:hypothetical protein
MRYGLERGLRGGALHCLGGKGAHTDIRFARSIAHLAGGVQTTDVSFSTKQIDIMPERRSTRNTPP